LENLKGQEKLPDLVVDRKIVFRYVVYTVAVGMLIGFNQLRVSSGDRLL
jgi:hypothetical protein